MGIGDGNVLGTSKLIDHGPDEDKWNLVITGDGFKSAELATFQSTVDSFVIFLQTQSPFSGTLTWDKVNIHRIDVESTDSGADNPNCDGTLVDTYFDAEFCVGGTDRVMLVNETLVQDTANLQVPEWDALLVFVNSTVYGGGGGLDGVAVASLADPDWVGLHELGHGAFGLADEYCYGAGIYTGSEPIEPNVTAVNTLTGLKWASLVDPATPIPTTTNPDLTCLTCDTQPSPVAVGTVGLFEGAMDVACGCYRPEYNCLMRNFYVGFCTVCTDRVLGRLSLGSLLDLTPCLVATSVYGDPQHPDVMTLRRWRDRHLQPGARGAPAMRLLVAGYARAGPVLARVTRSRPRLAGLLRARVFAPWARLLRRREGTVP